MKALLHRPTSVGSACAVAALTILAAGCGSGSSNSAATPGGGAAGGGSSPGGSSSGGGTSAGALTVSESEYKLTPSDPKTKPGSVRITATNAGGVVHALEVEGAGAGGKDVRSADIQPGASATVSVQLSPGKTYQWYCPIGGHKGLGMKGTITAAAGSSGAGGAASPSGPGGGSTGSGSGGSGGY